MSWIKIGTLGAAPTHVVHVLIADLMTAPVTEQLQGETIKPPASVSHMEMFVACWRHGNMLMAIWRLLPGKLSSDRKTHRGAKGSEGKGLCWIWENTSGIREIMRNGKSYPWTFFVVGTWNFKYTEKYFVMSVCSDASWTSCQQSEAGAQSIQRFVPLWDPPDWYVPLQLQVPDKGFTLDSFVHFLYIFMLSYYHTCHMVRDFGKWL